jgi:hypothetical protein
MDFLKEIANSNIDAENYLWQKILEYQDSTFYTSTGLTFSYTVKRRKDGEYSGELIISRKEGSKTLTKSSIMLAFRKVLEDAADIEFKAPYYKGPKAIGQIFGISYIYSIFWNLGLISVPKEVEIKLNGIGDTL